jgi:hypothetical protein
VRNAWSSGLRWRVVFVACALVNMVAVYAPSDEGAGSIFPGADKLGHVLLFGAVAWSGRRAGLPATVLGTVLAVHAVTSELAQAALLPHRSGDARDVVADLLGVALGLALARAPRRAPQGQPDGVR